MRRFLASVLASSVGAILACSAPAPEDLLRPFACRERKPCDDDLRVQKIYTAPLDGWTCLRVELERGDGLTVDEPGDCDECPAELVRCLVVEPGAVVNLWSASGTPELREVDGDRTECSLACNGD